MFYEETDISELVICPYCKNKYNDPRLVSCGNSFCRACIEFLTKSGTNGFQCCVCDTFHEQPKNGFSKNINLAKLCEKKANKVYRSPLANAFETDLDELKLSMGKLSKQNDLGADKIKEYCDGLRNKVQLHLEESIENLKKKSLKLIQKIDEHENETMLKFNANHNLRLDTFLSETRQFHEKWADYLKQFEINEEEIKVALLEAKKLKVELNKESDLLVSKLFHNNLLKFEKSTPCFGSLVNERVKLNYIQALASPKIFHLGNKMDYKNISKVSFKLLSNANRCIAYRKNNDVGLSIGIWDNDVNQLFKKRVEPFGHHGFQLVELNKAVVLCSIDDAFKSTIMKFDCNLKLQKNIEVGFTIMHADSYQNKLYLLATSLDLKSKHVYVLDESLKMLDNFKLGNSEGLPFYFPKLVTKMRVAEKYFVFLDGKNVLLMDRLDGMIKQTFGIGSSDFLLDSSNDRIIAHDVRLGRLVFFDFEGESFEISYPTLKNFELVDFIHNKFVLLYEKSFFYLF